MTNSRQTTDLALASAVDLARMVRAGEVSPVEILDAVYDRIKTLDSRVNAFCALTEESARAHARAAEAQVAAGSPLGPLHGVPVSIKDLLLTRGVRTMRGSAVYADFVPQENAPAVDLIQAAGAIVIGKTTTPELGWKGVTDSPVTGVTRNPWNLDLTPGGSSGGAAVAVALGMGPLAVGTDGGGSIRIPASFTGVFGLKPSFGRVPVFPPSAVGVMSHVGPIAFSVRDAGLMLNGMTGADVRDPFSLPANGMDYLAACDGGAQGLRVAWSPTLGYAPVDLEVRTLCERAARVFADELGCVVEEADPGFANPAPFFKLLWACGLGAAVRDYFPAWAERMDPGLVAMVREYDGASAAELAGAHAERLKLYDVLRRFFERYDLLLTPTMPTTAWKAGVPIPVEIAGGSTAEFRYTPFTFPFNMSGHPAASVPCGLASSGMPVGLQIVGRRWADAQVLRAAAAFEEARPWPRPPMSRTA